MSNKEKSSVKKIKSASAKVGEIAPLHTPPAISPNRSHRSSDAASEAQKEDTEKVVAPLVMTQAEINLRNTLQKRAEKAERHKQAYGNVKS